MTTWTQIYEPMGNIWLSSAVALIPIVFFFVGLALFRMKGYSAGIMAVVLAFFVAVIVYKMPVTMAIAATAYGFTYGIWPIAWIIVTAVLLYKITVKTGHFEVIRSSVASITEDQRLQALLVAFSFGAFLDGAAGFGAPVAIAASLLVGLGFNPLYAAGLCLIANTAPVAFGAMGIPITVSGQLTGISAHEIGQIAGRQLPFLSLIVPLWIVMIMDGIRGVREVWPAILVVGGSFSLTQFFTSNFIGPELPDITSSLVSLIALALFLKVWKPKRIFQFGKAVEEANAEVAATAEAGRKYSPREIFLAWSPFLVLTIMVTIWTLKPFKMLFAKGGFLEGTTIIFSVPGLNKLIMKSQPIVEKVTPYVAEFKLDLVASTGTAIFIAAIISAYIFRMNFLIFLSTFRETIVELRWPIFTIGTVLGFAFIANYSGQSATLALLLAGSGTLFPFFSPILGWLGVFLTGSDTSSNALFSNLQQITANRIGVNDALLVAANSTGGVTGKMISPQSIAIATASVGLVGKESDLFRFTVKHSIIFGIFIGIITYLQAYVFPGMLP